MGYKHVRQVLELSQASGSDRMVLCVIAEHVNEKSGVAWPALDLIAAEAGITRRSARRSVVRLKEMGELLVDVHGAPQDGTLPDVPYRRWQYRSNAYRLNLVVTPSRDTDDPTTNLVGTLVASSGDTGGNLVGTPATPKPLVEPLIEPKYSCAFDEFWDVYPNRGTQGKDAVRGAWETALELERRELAEVFDSNLDDHVAQVTADVVFFAQVAAARCRRDEDAGPDAITWLNQRRWTYDDRGDQCCSDAETGEWWYVGHCEHHGTEGMPLFPAYHTSLLDSTRELSLASS